MEDISKINSFSEIKELSNQIQESFYSGTVSENTQWLLLKDYYSNILLRKEFDKTVATSYSSVLSTLLDVLQPALFAEKWQENLFDNVFLQGIHHQSFLLLVKRLEKSEEYALQKIIDLLLKFIQGSSFEYLFAYQCISHKDWDIRYVSKSSIWDDLITAIVSLPERIANKTRGKFIKLFSPATFVPLLLSAVFKVLRTIHKLLQETEDSQEQECSLEFLSKLTGRICIVGHADIVAKKFSERIIKLSRSDFIWRRISQNFITKMPPSSLDSFITSLLLEIPWYGNVEWILGDEGVKNEKMNYIMTVKLLFYRPFERVIILQNTIGYFASSSTRFPHFINILNVLLDSWVDKRALRHQSLEQKMYIASALMICTGWLKKSNPEFENKECIRKVLEGVQIRLESSEETVRSLGMIVGGHLLKSLDPECHPLEFECTDLDLVNHLTSMMEIPSDAGDISLSNEDLKCFEEVESESKKERNPSKNHDIHTTEEFESDDDLEPYDMSHDIPQSEKKRPLYLRDCMMGLMDQDAEWAEKCLKYAEELIKADPYATEEVAEEMAKIVLHLGNTLSIPDFVALRHRILIALTAQCPVVVSSFLISQFAEKEFTIRQRLDILEVLAATSALLSTISLPAPQTHPNTSDGSVEKEPNWQIVIRERLEAKTKRYTKAQIPTFKENKFSAVCGNFFYPLLNSYERACEVLKLHDRDSYVLGRFIYTLGIIMYYASNTLHCSQMGLTLLQFLSTLRCHKDEFVRKCIIFAVSATYTAVPPPLLFSKEMLLQDVSDTSEWLQSVAESDPDSSCMEKALNALSILRSVANEDPIISQLKNMVL